MLLSLRSNLILLLFALTTCRRAVAAESAAPAAAAAVPSRADSTQASAPTLDDLLARADSLSAARGGAHVEKTRLYLTWDAPYGMPRARRTHSPRAHDPESVDTLWLSFLPGRTSEGFLGFRAELYFRAAPGDTLGPWWHMEGKGQNPREMVVEFGPDASSFPQAQPWAVTGFGGIQLERTPASAYATITFAVPYSGAVKIAPDSVYTLCRILLHHHRTLPGCSQPVCMEWGRALLSFWLHDDATVTQGERFVSYASDSAVCQSFLPALPDSPAAAPVKRPARARPPGVPRSRKPAR